MSARFPIVFLSLVLLGGCAHALNLGAIQDAQAVMRVKTALVNDPAVGVLPIQVRVADGVATLSGAVRSEADISRAVALAESVEGITTVRQTLQIGIPEAPVGTSPIPDLPGTDADGPPRRGLGVGISTTYAAGRGALLSSTLGAGPTIRLGGGNGLGTAVGFGWRRADLESRASATSLGCMKVRPVMAGLGYTLGNDRVSVAVSAVGGVAFNSLCDTAGAPGPEYALTVTNSLATRAGVSTWFELNRRVALNVFTGYLVTRPRLTTVGPGGTLDAYRVRADAAILSVGFVYKPF